MIVLLKIDVPNIKTTKDAHVYCQQLAEAIVSLQLNDDCGIAKIQYSVPKEKGE